MNRRSFLDSILKAGIGAAILPMAVTYARTWKRTQTGKLWAYLDQTACQNVFISSKYEEAIMCQYNCIILPTVNHYQLKSETFQTVIDIPAWIENFSIP